MPQSGGHLLGKWRKMALTDIAIRSAKPRAKPYKLGDTLGLFLLVQPTGGKLWRLKYRVDGREKKLGIGTYPEISLANARKRRDDARELMATGKDPSREKQRDKTRARLASDPTRDLRGALTAPTVTHYGAITDSKRVGELLRAIDGYDGQGLTKHAMQLAPHVFVRPGELRHAEWAEFDLEGALWTIPPEKTKMRKAHHVPPLTTARHKRNATRRACPT
jgi:integrase